MADYLMSFVGHYILPKKAHNTLMKWHEACVAANVMDAQDEQTATDVILNADPETKRVVRGMVRGWSGWCDIPAVSSDDNGKAVVFECGDNYSDPYYAAWLVSKIQKKYGLKTPFLMTYAVVCTRTHLNSDSGGAVLALFGRAYHIDPYGIAHRTITRRQKARKSHG